jgi:hypothetical protein
MTEQDDIVAGLFTVDPIDAPRNDEVNKDCQRSPGKKIGAKLQIIAKTNSTYRINRRFISWLAVKKAQWRSHLGYQVKHFCAENLTVINSPGNLLQQKHLPCRFPLRICHVW